MQNTLRKFYWITLVMIAALVILLSVQYYAVQKTFENEMLESNEKNLSAMVFEIGDWLGNQKKVIETAAKFITFNQWTEELTLGYFEVLLNENASFSSIYLGTEDNMMINASGWIPPADFDLRQRPWYVKAAGLEETVLTDFFENASGDNQIITVARAVYDPDGSFHGVVGGDISSQTIYNIIQKYQFGGIQNSIIVNEQKEIQMIVNKNEDDAINQDLQAEIIEYIENDTLSETIEIRQINRLGTDEYICQIPIDGTDWHIYSLIKVLNISAFRTLLKQSLIALLILMGVFLALMRQLIKGNADLSLKNRRVDGDRSGNQIASNLHPEEKPLNQEDPCVIQELKMKALFDQSPDAMARFDGVMRIVEINSGFAALFGTELSDSKDLKVHDIISRDQAMDEEGERQIVQGRDGQEIPVAVKKIPIAGEMEKWGGFLILSDLRDQLTLEMELKKQVALFDDLFRNSTDAIALFDKDRRVININDQFTLLFEYELDEIKGKKIDQALTMAEGLADSEKLTANLLDGQKIISEGIRYGSDGLPREVLIKGFPIILNEKVIGGYGIYVDLSARKRAEKEILYISYHDQLTGLYNRRFFEEEYNRLNVKRNMPMAMIMADVNGLKLINDAFGHQVGDDLLKITARIFEDVCRGDEIIARLGGDEFVILLPKTNLSHAEKIVQRIKRECLNRMVNSIEISISFGWDIKSSLDDTFEDLFKRVEDGMYRNKLIESPSVHTRMFETIIQTLHEKNPHEERHSLRVSELSAAIAFEMGMGKREVEELRTAGWLHDIGKVAIKESVLNKEGNLTPDDWNEIRRHPEIGYRIISTVNEMAEFAEYVLVHHERWDGKGYPRGIAGEAIPLAGRILAVADAYDTMTMERVYQKILSNDEAIKELQKNAGTQFDPEIVEIFINKVLRKRA